MTEVSCECGARLDICGRHRGACARARAVGPERYLARVCREAGATVRTNTLLACPPSMRGQSRSWRPVSLCIMTLNSRWISLSGALWGHAVGPPKCIPHRWCCPRCCSARQRTEVSRTSAGWAETVFGQSIFGHRVLRPANFGQIQFWPIHFWRVLVVSQSVQPEGWEPRRVGALKGGSPEGWGP